MDTDDLLDVMATCEPYTASELAERLDEPRRTVSYNLEQLKDQGIVSKKKHSQRTVTWWIESDRREGTQSA